MSLVIVGSVAYDALQTPHGKVDRILGGACTYSALSASYFTPVSIVGVVGEDFAETDVEMLTSHGIDVEGLERVPGKTFFWSGVYSDDMNDRTTLVTELNVFASFDPKLPASYRTKPYLFLGNIQPTLQKAVKGQMDGVKLVGGDTMNYWIVDHRDALLETIKEWDFLLINDSEARLLSGKANLKHAAATILDLGPRTVIIKRGEYGALLFWRMNGGIRWVAAPGYLLDEVFDPTGAGDCFAGGFMGYLASRGIDLATAEAEPKELLRAVIYGSVMGSFCCEKFGPERFRTLSRSQVDARFQEFQAATAF